VPLPRDKVWLREEGRHIYRERKRDGDQIDIDIDVNIDTLFFRYLSSRFSGGVPLPREEVWRDGAPCIYIYR